MSTGHRPCAGKLPGLEGLSTQESFINDPILKNTACIIDI